MITLTIGHFWTLLSMFLFAFLLLSWKNDLRLDSSQYNPLYFALFLVCFLFPGMEVIVLNSIDYNFITIELQRPLQDEVGMNKMDNFDYLIDPLVQGLY